MHSPNSMCNNGARCGFGLALATAFLLFGSVGTASAARFDFDATPGRLPNVGLYSGLPGLAKDFILAHFEEVQAKASRSRKSWTLPATFAGFNDNKQADELLAAQRRLVGDEALAPAEQTAEAIREKAAVREREERQIPELLRSLTKSGQHVAASGR